MSFDLLVAAHKHLEAQDVTHTQGLWRPVRVDPVHLAW